MAYLKIVTKEDPILRKTSRKVEQITPRILTLLDDMTDTLHRANGAGLAAVQVGVLRRIVLVETDETGLVEMINPVITKREGEQTGREGCLSLPGRQGVVTRPMTVTVNYQDRRGAFQQLTAEGFFARACCHEIDHLDGRVYIDVMDRELTPEEIEGHIPEDDDE